MSSEVESDRATSTAGGQVVGGEFRTLETTVTVFETEAESLSSTNLNFQEDRIAKVGFVTKPASCSAKARSRLW
jgi:hypothetical protein